MRPVYTKFSGDDAPFELSKSGSKLEEFIAICAGKGLDIKRNALTGKFNSDKTELLFQEFLNK